MKLVAGTPEKQPATRSETVALSQSQYEMLRKLSADLNPDTPLAFGGAHAVRTIIERLEEAQPRPGAPKRRRRR